jgi:hypothetical protein
LARLRDDLAKVDAVLRLFSPDDDPQEIPSVRARTYRALFFKRGEQPRACASALREAGGPATTRTIADHVLVTLGMASAGADERAVVTTQVRQCLMRMERRGRVLKVFVGPDAWWDLPPQD